MSIIAVGMDLAKNIFAVHGFNENDRTDVVIPRVALAPLLPLLTPKFVTPYRMSGKRGKNDAADAAALCEAVTRPQMRYAWALSASPVE